jgi:phage shock protein A
MTRPKQDTPKETLQRDVAHTLAQALRIAKQVHTDLERLEQHHKQLQPTAIRTSLRDTLELTKQMLTRIHNANTLTAVLEDINTPTEANP